MQIAPGLYSISQKKGGHVHAYMIDVGESLILIDTLFDSDASVVLAAIAAAGKQVSQLEHIILTHAHRSHLGGLATLKRLSNATVYSHGWEQGIIAGKRKATPVGLRPRRPLSVYNLQFGLALGLAPHIPCDVDRELKDGDHVGPLEIVSVPGHTPGSLAFFWRERRALVVGDVVTTWPRVEAGWRGLTLDYDQNLRSIGKLSDASDTEVLCVGHGGPVTFGAARLLRELRDGRPATVSVQLAAC